MASLRCSVNGCQKRFSDPGILFYSFPSQEKQPERWQIWLDFCGKPKSWIPVFASKMCSVHFATTSFDTTGPYNGRLLPYALPQLAPALPYIPPVIPEPTVSAAKPAAYRWTARPRATTSKASPTTSGTSSRTSAAGQPQSSTPSKTSEPAMPNATTGSSADLSTADVSESSSVQIQIPENPSGVSGAQTETPSTAGTSEKVTQDLDRMLLELQQIASSQVTTAALIQQLTPNTDTVVAAPNKPSKRAISKDAMSEDSTDSDDPPPTRVLRKRTKKETVVPSDDAETVAPWEGCVSVDNTQTPLKIGVVINGAFCIIDCFRSEKNSNEIVVPAFNLSEQVTIEQLQNGDPLIPLPGPAIKTESMEEPPSIVPFGLEELRTSLPDVLLPPNWSFVDNKDQGNVMFVLFDGDTNEIAKAVGFAGNSLNPRIFLNNVLYEGPRFKDFSITAVDDVEKLLDEVHNEAICAGHGRLGRSKCGFLNCPLLSALGEYEECTLILDSKFYHKTRCGPCEKVIEQNRAPKRPIASPKITPQTGKKLLAIPKPSAKAVKMPQATKAAITCVSPRLLLPRPEPHASELNGGNAEQSPDVMVVVDEAHPDPAKNIHASFDFGKPFGGLSILVVQSVDSMLNRANGN